MVLGTWSGWSVDSTAVLLVFRNTAAAAAVLNCTAVLSL
jgi:hypothetical protein